MTKRYATLAGLGSVLALLVIVGLLSGFVPDRFGSSLSRKVSSHVAQARGDDLPVLESPGSISYSARVNPPETELENSGLSVGLVAFDTPPAEENAAGFVALSEQGVRFQTVNGPLILSPPQPLGSCAWSPLNAELEADALNEQELAPQENVNVLTTLLASCAVPRFTERFFLAPEPEEKQIELPQLGNQMSYTLRARRYEQSIQRMAKKYVLDVYLVKALIHTESGFNPHLVSSRSAMGLMQVVASSAGGEVHHFLHGQAGLPDVDTLLDPDTNITYGTSYLHLLLTRHFGAVRNMQAREYCAIAAYNGGPNAVLRMFSAERDTALALINDLTPQQLYDRLRADLPAQETRNFLGKVLALRQQYAQSALALLQ